MEPYSFEERKDGEHILMATQQEAIDLIKSGKNVAILGPGGTGKSYLTRMITDKHTIVCSPTGVAAINAGGTTCHRAFALPIGIPTIEDYTKVSTKVRKLLGSKHLKRVVIDEIGMLRGDYLDLINHRLQQCRNNKLAWGGIQMIVVGDFAQLAPIVNQRESQLFYKEYSTAYAFGSKSWNFEVCLLEKSYRQENEIHVRVLNSFRKKDKWCGRAIDWLGEQCIPFDPKEDILSLCAYKVDAERINNVHYSKLKEVEKVYRGITNNTRWPADLAVPQEVRLKVGAKVLIKANDVEGQYVNGNRGTVAALHPTHVTVTLDSGENVDVEMFTWEALKYESTVKGLTKSVEWMYQQIPLALGWSVTIHAAQGLTLDRYAIETGRGCFAAGQFYVAISRARDLSKVSLASVVGLGDVIADTDVLEFYKEFEFEG